MALKPLLSFSTGELDPVLTDNVTLEKFNKGLTTARNVIIGKTGSILSRFTTYHCENAKNPDEQIVIYQPTNSNYLLEWGDSYVRVYTIIDTLFIPGLSFEVELSHSFTEADLPFLHFATSKDFVYVFRAGQEQLKLKLDTTASAFISDTDMFAIPDPLTSVSVSVSGSTGYNVDYLATIVINGEESLAVENTTGYAKPIAIGEDNTVGVLWPTLDVDIDQVSEVRIYSRPSGGGAYGLLGTTTDFLVGSPNTAATYIDIGSLPDYTNGIQDIITKFGLAGKDIIDLYPKTGIIYQQRLIITSEDDDEALIASRPGFQNNFYRDFPYAADSALQFKAGTSGRAKVLRMLESDGLVVFTTNGVYTSVGLLSVNNLALDRKGGWIIDENLPPLVVPGGVFFVDRSNTIRQLIFSQDILAYESIEQTIFSNHLFRNRTIKSWAFQDGIAPLIIVVFSDGEFASFTYNFEHQMRAWTRHDSVYPMEQVVGTTEPDKTFFVVNKNGQRSIEVSLPRRVPVAALAGDTEADKLPHNAFMDSISMTNGQLAVTDFVLSPVVPGDWEGVLNITTVSLATLFFVVGETYRFFNPDDGAAIDLVVTAVIDPENARLQPSEEFPSAYGTGAELYQTYNTVTTGLAHLEGESVSVVVDGSLVASPLNDIENYPTITVTGGAITLPDSMRGAIIHVGRPIVADIKTLNISTLEQSPTLIESLTVNKLYVRINETRGLYCANKFPEEANDQVDGSSVVGMEDLDEYQIPVSGNIVGNRYLAPASKRVTKSIPGSWDSQGQISFRQVDPYHFEILSIIPDVEILSRGR